MEHDRAGQLVDRIGVLGQPADLDFLIFFARHPRILIATDRLAALTGYRPQQTADSLAVLLKAGLITGSQKPLTVSTASVSGVTSIRSGGGGAVR